MSDQIKTVTSIGLLKLLLVNVITISLFLIGFVRCFMDCLKHVYYN